MYVCVYIYIYIYLLPCAAVIGRGDETVGSPHRAGIAQLVPCRAIRGNSILSSLSS